MPTQTLSEKRAELARRFQAHEIGRLGYAIALADLERTERQFTPSHSARLTEDKERSDDRL